MKTKRFFILKASSMCINIMIVIFLQSHETKEIHKRVLVWGSFDAQSLKVVYTWSGWYHLRTGKIASLTSRGNQVFLSGYQKPVCRKEIGIFKVEPKNTLLYSSFQFLIAHHSLTAFLYHIMNRGLINWSPFILLHRSRWSFSALTNINVKRVLYVLLR